MITKSLEDYLEIIYNSISQDENIKAADIAKKLNISRSSVSEALIRLMDMDLIVYEGRKGIKITDSGIIEAKKITGKHKVLYSFFKDILDLNSETAAKNACEIEHVIDNETIKKITDFSEFCLKNNINTKFKESVK